jgi:hypothetical protein
LASYGLVIWRWGFGPADRMLFRRSGGDDGLNKE